MPQLDINLARESTTGKALTALVSEYNQLPEDEAVARLFYLQKITHLIYDTRDSEIINWRNQLGESGLESHLQHYGIHKDASILLAGIEFAQAVREHSPFEIVPERSLFEAMKARDKAFESGRSGHAALDDYVKNNLAIMANYDKDEALRAKVARSRHFLVLSYAKIEAIQGFVQQNFDSYQTGTLGGTNNKNYVFNVDKADSLVIRIEDRASLDDEWLLQTDEVGEYFSEDYATVRVLIKDNDNAYYLPLIVSQFAKKGDLARYARGLVGEKPEIIHQEVHNLFGQLNDFCGKLMASGHYHPDIKLSNFLLDEEGRLIVSDRKAIIKQENPGARFLKSTPYLAPPEFSSAKKVYMPSYMAFQIGLALKEFMLKSNGVSVNEHNEEELAEFLSWRAITPKLTPSNNESQNISVLIQELTRPVPRDRLSIENFQLLLAQTHLTPEAFMEKLLELSPQKELSTHDSIELIKKMLNPKLIEQILAADPSDPAIAKALAPLLDLPHFNILCRDPRIGLADNVANRLDQIQNHLVGLEKQEEKAQHDKVVADLAEVLNQKFKVQHENPIGNMQEFLRSEPLKYIKEYLFEVEHVLRKEDFQKAGFWEQLLQIVGWKEVPKRTSVSDLGDKLPPMDSIVRDCIKLSRATDDGLFPELDSKQQAVLQQINPHFVPKSPSTFSMLEKLAGPGAPPRSPSYHEVEAIDVMVQKGNKAIKEPGPSSGKAEESSEQPEDERRLKM